MEARGIRLQGEHGISRKAIAQGMPECSDCTCILVCVFFAYILHTRPRVQQAPGISCSLFEGQGWAKLGRNAPRERNVTFNCHRPRRRVTQYSRGSSDRIDEPRRTGSPAFAGDDDGVLRRYLPVIASKAKQSISLRTR